MAFERSNAAGMTSAAQATKLVCLILLACWFLVAPIYSLIVKAPFDWHIHQPEAWQGGSEVLVLLALCYGALSLKWRRVRVPVVLLLGWLYARRHGIDLAVLGVYLYAEAILALGWLLLPAIGLPRMQRPSTLLVAGVAGVIAWSLVIWLASAFGYGSLPALRVMALVVLAPALVLARGPLLGRRFVHKARRQQGLERLTTAFLIAFFLALFAKTAVVNDFDSLWYGLQADRVLVGAGNLYRGQALTGLVHYYPKLYEALQLPFAALGSISLILGTSVFSWLLVAITTPVVLREFQVGKQARLWAMLLVATIPAVANSAIIAKGDLFSTWLMMVALLGMFRYRNGKGGVWFWVAFCTIPLAVMARLSVLPYAGVLGIMLVSLAIVRRVRREPQHQLINRGLVLLAATVLLLSLVTARTLLLAGVPIIAPDFLVYWASDLGLPLKYPIGLIPILAPERIPLWLGLWRYLFDPGHYILVMIMWTGNVWALLPIAVLLLKGRQVFARFGAWSLVVLGSLFFVVLFGYAFRPGNFGADGNYFIFPVICLTLSGAILARSLRGSAATWLTGMAMAFAFSSAAIAFVTGSWGPGTRAFDHVMNRTPFDFEKRREVAIAKDQLAGVWHYLQRAQVSPSTRVVGWERTAADIMPPAAFWLPVRYEPLYVIAYSREEAFRSGTTFISFLSRTDIEYVIIPDPGPSAGISTPVPRAKAVLAALASLKEQGLAAIVYQDASYALWKLEKIHVENARLDGGQVQIETSEASVCGDHATAQVTWAVAGLINIAVEVKTLMRPIPALWIETGSRGSAATGPWVSNGTEFVFRRDDHSGKVIGKATVQADCRPKA